MNAPTYYIGGFNVNRLNRFFMPSTPNPCLALAIKAVKYYLESGKILSCPQNLPEELKRKSGAFVSIKKGKTLRGCIGTVAPTEKNLAIEIIQNAVNAATKDPRFSPISKTELAGLNFSVDVITPSEKVDHISDLDCKKYGIIVKSKDKQAVLLPDLEGVDTVDQQIDICRKKASLQEDEPIQIYRFQVERYR